MDSLDLYGKEEKLLQMCRKLFPEYKDFYFHSGKGDSGSCEHIGLGIQNPDNKDWVDYTYIHWFELCSTYILERLYRDNSDLENYMNCVFTYKFMDWHLTAERTHPVDYLYNLYKKYNV
jgi:hypothetical protein